MCSRYRPSQGRTTPIFKEATALQSKQQTEVRDQVATAKSLNWRAMHLDKAIRAAVAREVAPLIADCERIRAAIDRAEAALPIVLDRPGD